MANGMGLAKVFAAVVLVSICGTSWAQSRVTYGRITAVSLVPVESTRAQTGGAILGGTLGVISGSGQSGSNRALRGVGGAFAGQQLGRMASSRQAFEYTILLGGTSTVTMVTDEGGLRVGDCVAVERGSFNNLRLAPDARCAPSARPTPAPAAAVNEANACVAAKQQLLTAETEEAFDRAERRVRLLCND